LKPRLFAIAYLAVAAATQTGCGLWSENVNAQRRGSAEQIEPLLEQAGFLKMRPETPAQTAEMESLKPLVLSHSLDPKKGARYWFADPYLCNCLYAGDEAAFQRLREVQRANEETAQMKADKRLNEQAWDQVSEGPEINMFNPAFSP
jgi:hypothetical protein